MSNDCIGTLNEFYDGNPPFTARGAMSFAMSVAETLRAITILRDYTKQNDEGASL